MKRSKALKICQNSAFLLCFANPLLNSYGAVNLEMRLEGDLQRRLPFPPVNQVETGSVGRVELNLWDGGSSFGQAAGVHSFANDRGSFAIHASTSRHTATNCAFLRWKGDFTKLPSNVPFTYTVNPSRLYLVAPGGDPTNHLLASWKLSVSVNGVEQMSSEHTIEGFPQFIGPSLFVLTSTNPGPIQILHWDPIPAFHSVEYTTRRFKGQLDLSGLTNGEPFTVEYEMSTKLIDTLGRESLADAYVGDPLDYGSGIQMSYGAFGELFFLYQLTIDEERGAILLTPHEPDFYFILCRRIGLDGVDLPVALRLGGVGNGELVDPNPPQVASPVFYSVKKIPISDPQDADNDGIHDVYELEHPGILDPVDAVDATEDPDGDSYNNLAEFQNGTDPNAVDPPPAQLVHFPGIIVPTYSGGEFIDLNNDGVLDLAASALVTALGNPGGSFQTPTNSPVPGSRRIADTAYVNLDGDLFPDALAVDQLTNRLFVLRGLGNGRFEPLTNYPTLGDLPRIVVGDLNDDTLPDAAIMSRNGRGADLFVAVGDGTLTRLTPVTTNAFGTARGIALGDFNGDGRDDVVVGYASTAVIFLTTNGVHGSGTAYPVGSSPESIAVGDLNRDGRLDIVTANRTSDDISILFGAPGTTFLPQVRYATGDLPLGLRLADLNKDSILDVIVSRVGVEYQTVFLTQTNGTLGAPYTVPTGGLAAILDWNEDGNLDLFSGISGIGGLVNLGNGDGTFATYLQIVPTNSPPTQVKPIDLNGDNQLELIGLQAQRNSIDVWEHAAVTGTNRLLSSFVVGPYVTAFTHGDFNGDNLADLAVLTHTNTTPTVGMNRAVILTNQGAYSFQIAANVPFDFQPRGIVAGDFNGDGDLDLAVTLANSSNERDGLVALLGDGTGGFQAGVPVEVGDVALIVDAADVDGDLRSEIVLKGTRIGGGFSTNFVEVYAFDTAAGWTNRQALSFSNAVLSLQIVSANGDAFPDLVMTEVDLFTGESTLTLHPGSATGFAPRQVLADDVGFQLFSRLTDLNADGRLDVISGNTLFIARPTGGFYPGHGIWIGTAGAQDVADFNNDGKADLMSGLNILLQE